MAISPPYLRELVFNQNQFVEGEYPFTLPWLRSDKTKIKFTKPVTIIVGENGVGKSTLIEAIAEMSGYDQAGGGKGYSPVNHDGSLEKSGSRLSAAMRAGWFPKVTDGWFFRAETFFSVARYLNEAQSPNDFLSKSHGEGFIDLFSSKLGRKGIFILDEPEAALSIQSQLVLLALISQTPTAENSQIIMATHSPILMTIPNSQIMEIRKDHIYQLDNYKSSSQFQLMKRFINDTENFISLATQNTI